MRWSGMACVFALSIWANVLIDIILMIAGDVGECARMENDKYS